MSDGAKQRILIALRDLSLAAGFDAISVRDIVVRADVGRSTFYENFENKGDGFRAILEPVLLPLAYAGASKDDRSRLIATLIHMRETPAAGRMTAGAARPLIVGALAQLIEVRLDVLRRRAAGTVTVPQSLGAVWIAEAQIGVIKAWLDDAGATPVETIAKLVISATRSCVDALAAARL